MSVAKRLIEEEMEQIDQETKGEMLEPANSVTLKRPDLIITVALNQPHRKGGTTQRTEARPIGLKIQFDHDNHSWLNEQEMRMLASMITTGKADAIQC
tara:strand:- start:655 stop:948 length:294 start_codon:yes stop_codon:yes gene_type:complete